MEVSASVYRWCEDRSLSQQLAQGRVPLVTSLATFLRTKSCPFSCQLIALILQTQIHWHHQHATCWASIIPQTLIVGIHFIARLPKPSWILRQSVHVEIILHLCNVEAQTKVSDWVVSVHKNTHCVVIFHGKTWKNTYFCLPVLKKNLNNLYTSIFFST